VPTAPPPPKGPPSKAAPPQTDAVMQQIAQAWDDAKSQLAELRDAVEQNAKMAHLKLEASFLNRERDVALRDFGESVWNQVMRGRLQLPPQLSAALQKMIDVEKKLQKQAAEITDILKEGDEAAERLRQKKAARPSPALASKVKKR
jgi:hypothetical protein